MFNVRIRYSIVIRTTTVTYNTPLFPICQYTISRIRKKTLIMKMIRSSLFQCKHMTSEMYLLVAVSNIVNDRNLLYCIVYYINSLGVYRTV